MGVDQTSLDRIRNATFPTARRGYDKHEVEKFLARLADWLETGAGDESRSDVVIKELEKVGERTGAILAQAEESAQQIRAEAEEEARGTVNTANMQAAEARTGADQYDSETRAGADAYARQTTQDADEEAAATRAKAEQEARETIEAAAAQARRIVEEGTQRREDIEAVIVDLVRRRDDVLGDTEELSSKLTAAVSQHRGRPGDDVFEKPEEFDPLAREGVAEQLEPEETRVPQESQDTEVAPESQDTEEHHITTEREPAAEPRPEHEADLRT
jgi:DivIVA domain-containing protein